MQKELLRFALSAIIIYLTSSTLNPAVAVTQPSGGHETHICGVSDYHPLWRQHSKRQDNRNYARTFANLNVGAPRTVRLIYFLPNDRPYRADVVQKMKDEVLKIQTFYAEQMEAHGYGRRTFRFETDAQGEPKVHRVLGQQPFIVNVTIIRTRIAAVYESRSKAIYWDGRNSLGEQVASGVYFYTLSAGDYSATQKMAILK